VTLRRFAAAGLALSLLCGGSALAQAQSPGSNEVSIHQTAPVDLRAADPEGTLVEELIVNAKLPGPAWWKVSDADSTVYVLAIPALSPKTLAFDTSVVERRLDGANRLIMAPEPDVSVVRIIALALGGRRYFLTDKPMRDTLPPELRARLEKRLADSGEKLDSMDDIKPAFAGFLVANMKKGGGSISLQGGGVADKIEAIAKKGDLKKRPRIQKLEGYDVIDALKSVGSLPKPMQEFCLDAGLREAEAGGSRVAETAETAQRWAEGDVVKLAAADRGYQACLSATPGVASEIRKTIDRSTKAIDQALKTPGKSVALVNFRPLLSEEGVLVRLKAKGYTITTPAETQP